jgi:hypothetical protein
MTIDVVNLANEVTQARVRFLFAESGSVKRQPPLPIQILWESRHTRPCGSHPLLRHIRSGRIHWNRQPCYQERQNSIT